MRLSDRFTTGSSIMPQKRNPDAAELVRAKVGRVAAAFQGLLMVMKGLPLAYAKDMQEDKEPAFDALASLQLALAAMTGMVEDLEPDAEAMRRGRGLRLLDRHRPGRLAGARAWPAVPRGAPYHRPDRRGGRGQRRGTSTSCRSRPCRRWSRASPGPFSPCFPWRARSGAARAMVERRHRTCAKWP